MTGLKTKAPEAMAVARRFGKIVSMIHIGAYLPGFPRAVC